MFCQYTLSFLKGSEFKIFFKIDIKLIQWRMVDCKELLIIQERFLFSFTIFANSAESVTFYTAVYLGKMQILRNIIRCSYTYYFCHASNGSSSKYLHCHGLNSFLPSLVSLLQVPRQQNMGQCVSFKLISLVLNFLKSNFMSHLFKGMILDGECLACSEVPLEHKSQDVLYRSGTECGQLFPCPTMLEQSM